MNAVYNSRRGRNVQFAFIVGGGLAVARDLEGDDSGFNIGGGPELKVFLSSDSQTALIFGSAFQAGQAGFLRFTVGLEFALPGG